MADRNHFPTCVGVGIAAIFLAVFCSSKATGAALYTFTQQGNDVVVSGSGDFVPVGFGTGPNVIGDELSVGASFSFTLAAAPLETVAYPVTMNPSGDVFPNFSTMTGSFAGNAGGVTWMEGGGGVIAGNTATGVDFTATLANTTLAGMGLAQGMTRTTEFTFLNLLDLNEELGRDSITVTVLPEPTVPLYLSLGFVLFLRRRRKTIL